MPNDYASLLELAARLAAETADALKRYAAEPWFGMHVAGVCTLTPLDDE